MSSTDHLYPTSEQSNFIFFLKYFNISLKIGNFDLALQLQKIN